MKTLTKIVLLLTTISYGSVASAAVTSLDLSTWLSNGNGSWSLQGSNNDAVMQTENAAMTVFFDAGQSSIGNVFSGEISVSGTNNDDDFWGFVLGYQDGELSSRNGSYYLIDWRKTSQTYNGVLAEKGLSFSVVDGLGSFNNYWEHSGAINEIERGLVSGGTGWSSGVTYNYDITYTSDLIEVFINNTLELSISASEAGLANFSDGSFGFYNFSQSDVTYARSVSSESSDSIQVNEPSMLLLLGFCIISLITFRKRTLRV